MSRQRPSRTPVTSQRTRLRSANRPGRQERWQPAEASHIFLAHASLIHDTFLEKHCHPPQSAHTCSWTPVEDGSNACGGAWSSTPGPTTVAVSEGMLGASVGATLGGRTCDASDVMVGGGSGVAGAGGAREELAASEKLWRVASRALLMRSPACHWLTRQRPMCAYRWKVRGLK